MSDPLSAFLTYLSLEKAASPHTLRSYRSDLCEFRTFVGPEKPLKQVDGRMVRAYLAHLHSRGLDASSVARKLAALRSWFRFLVRRRVLARNVAREIRGPRARRLPRTARRAARDALREPARRPALRPGGPRDRAEERRGSGHRASGEPAHAPPHVRDAPARRGR